MTHYNVRVYVEEVIEAVPPTIAPAYMVRPEEKDGRPMTIRSLVEFKTTRDTLAEAIKRATDVLALETDE